MEATGVSLQRCAKTLSMVSSARAARQGTGAAESKACDGRRQSHGDHLYPEKDHENGHCISRWKALMLGRNRCRRRPC